jgi:hypothetical protein
MSVVLNRRFRRRFPDTGKVFAIFTPTERQLFEQTSLLAPDDAII